MTEFTDLRELDQAIRDSAGMAYVNRSYGRGFSLNIFHRNAQELIEATHNVRDPEQGIRLMAVDNREAGQQAHREINRLVHNFVAGSMTLIDHTRQFIREHYADTPLEEAYKARVAADFASEPVAKFVQDLRNYMVHKGLPDSQMFLNFDNSSGTGGELTTGVRYETGTLTEWDGWTVPARKYIKAAGDHLDIHTFAESYLEKVLRFHEWLNTELQEFHSNDLEQLRAMQEAYARLSENHHAGSAPGPTATDTSALTPDEPVASFEFPESVAIAVDEAGKAILDKIRRLDFLPQPADTFPSERPISATLTNQNIIETPIVWRSDSEGRPVVAFLRSESEVFGLDANVYGALQPLADKVLELEWAKKALSRQFIEETTLRWFRSSFRVTEPAALSSALASASRDQVRPLDVWAPIAHLEVEERFAFGPVQIAPISGAMIDALEAKGINSSPARRENISRMFQNLRARMQGFAAVVVRVEAEPHRAQEDGMAIAQNAVGLLRFFSPVARESWRPGSPALLGTEIIPRSQALVLGEDYFSFSDGLIFPPFSWRLSKRDILALSEAGLSNASSLILADGLSEFSLAVRASLLLYGTGTTLNNPADRLIYSLSSVEGILLKHSMEPTEISVEERMSLLLASDKSHREEVARNVREAYRLRKRHGASVPTPFDEKALAMFAHNAYAVICTALANVNSFVAKADFVAAVERRRNASARGNS